MNTHSHPGKLITLEGLDGSGKSTQAGLLASALRDAGKRSHVTSEPTSGMIGGLIRSRLAGVWNASNECLQLLFSADRLYHAEQEILPMLKQGYWVVCDRYVHSTLAYGGATGISADWLAELNRHAILPDFVCFLEVSPETAMQRIGRERTETSLFEKRAVLENVRDGYEAAFNQLGPPVIRIDGEKPIDEVTLALRKALDFRMP